jgi:hypothetical protein
VNSGQARFHASRSPPSPMIFLASTTYDASAGPIASSADFSFASVNPICSSSRSTRSNVAACSSNSRATAARSSSDSASTLASTSARIASCIMSASMNRVPP